MFDQFVANRGRSLWLAGWLLTGDHQHAEDLVQTALMTRAMSGAAASLAAMVAVGALILVKPGEQPLEAFPASPSSTDTDQPSSPPPSSPGSEGPAQTSLVPEICQQVQAGTVKPEDLPADENLPLGAERVWLCGDLNVPFGGSLDPAEPLTADPDRVVRAVNELARHPAGDQAGCFDAGGLTFHLVVDYPDEQKVISAETVNCEWVGGWGNRIGGKALYDEVVAMWTQERDLGRVPQPEPEVLAAACAPVKQDYGPPGLHSFLPVRTTDAAVGVVCGMPADATAWGASPVVREIPASVIEALRTAEPTPVGDEGYRGPTATSYALITNQYGDPLSIGIRADGALAVDGAPGHEGGRWLPSGEVGEQWQETLAGMRLNAFYSTPAECANQDPAVMTGDLGRIEAGFACLGHWAIPEKGPELDPAFAAELGRRFEAEAQPTAFSQWRTDHVVVLRDGSGERRYLSWDGQEPAGLIDETGERTWQIPDDVQEELRAYGFTFTAES